MPQRWRQRTDGAETQRPVKPSLLKQFHQIYKTK